MFERRIRFIQSISSALKRYNFCQDVRDFIACQFALESDFGDSELACIHHNYSGMKNPLVRPSTAVYAGKCGAPFFADYDCLQSCVDDYVLWVAYRKPMSKELNSVELFSSLLRSYCPERDYVSKIQRIYLQFKSSIS